MQKIINELKLDFDDVLIKPKRSKLGSRSEVSLQRDFKFLYSDVCDPYSLSIKSNSRFLSSLILSLSAFL